MDKGEQGRGLREEAKKHNSFALQDFLLEGERSSDLLILVRFKKLLVGTFMKHLHLN